MKNYLIARTVAIDILTVGCIYLAYRYITQPELLANWIRVIRSGFTG